MVWTALAVLAAVGAASAALAWFRLPGGDGAFRPYRPGEVEILGAAPTKTGSVVVAFRVPPESYLVPAGAVGEEDGGSIRLTFVRGAPPGLLRPSLAAAFPPPLTARRARPRAGADGAHVFEVGIPDALARRIVFEGRVIWPKAPGAERRPD